MTSGRPARRATGSESPHPQSRILDLATRRERWIQAARVIDAPDSRRMHWIALAPRSRKSHPAAARGAARDAAHGGTGAAERDTAARLGPLDRGVSSPRITGGS